MKLIKKAWCDAYQERKNHYYNIEIKLTHRHFHPITDRNYGFFVEASIASNKVYKKLLRDKDFLGALLVAIKNLAYGAKRPTQLTQAIQNAGTYFSQMNPPLEPSDLMEVLKDCAQKDLTGQAMITMETVANNLNRRAVITGKRLQHVCYESNSLIPS